MLRTRSKRLAIPLRWLLGRIVLAASPNKSYEAVVIGGGFFGCCLALFLRRYSLAVAVLEKEPDLLLRASFRNQARVHNGYHYPRSLLTALRSFSIFSRFIEDFSDAVDDRFEKVYAIARSNSKVSAQQFRRLCEAIGAPIAPASSHIRKLFAADLIEEVFAVRECAFNSDQLREILRERLKSESIPVFCGHGVFKLTQDDGDGKIFVYLEDGSVVQAGRVFLCAYSRINSLLHQSGLPLLPFKHEIAEIALIEVPDELKHLGITLMDGPFFSTGQKRKNI